MHRIRRPLWIFGRRQVNAPLSFLRDDLSPGDDHLGAEVAQIVHEQDVGPAAGSDHAQFARQSEMFGGVEGAHLDGGHRLQSLGNGVAQDAVHVAVLRNRLRVRVVGAKDEAARIQFEFGDGLHLRGHVVPG